MAVGLLPGDELPYGLSGITPVYFSTVRLQASTDRLTALSAADHANRTVLIAEDLIFPSTNGGTLDLRDNDMILRSSAESTVKAYLNSGRNVATNTYNSGTWDGYGIASSTAHLKDAVAGYEKYLLGYALIDDLRGQYDANAYQDFDGIDVDSTDVIIKYTYNADFSLDGKVDSDDLDALNDNFSNTTFGRYFFQGDLGWNGTVDDDDVSILGLSYYNGTTTSDPQL